MVCFKAILLKPCILLSLLQYKQYTDVKTGI